MDNLFKMPMTPEKIQELERLAQKAAKIKATLKEDYHDENWRRLSLIPNWIHNVKVNHESACLERLEQAFNLLNIK
jgi:hypothetical protein